MPRDLAKSTKPKTSDRKALGPTWLGSKIASQRKPRDGAALPCQPSFESHCWEIVRCIPAGKVASYGQIAALAGYPGRARQVGKALGSSPSDVPWWRVLNASGQIRVSDPQRQADRLSSEGVQLVGFKVSLKTYRWSPPPLAFIGPVDI